MLKQLAVAVLAACAMSAHAEGVEKSWNFTWSGDFFYSALGETRHYDFQGSFSAIDANGDHQIVTSEVTAMTFDGYKVAPCGYTSCSLSSFVYGGGNALTFTAGTYEYVETPNDPFHSYYAYSHGWDINLGIINMDTYCQQCSISDWMSSGNATMTVTEVSAVPEPSTYAMLGLGLAVVGAAARRRQRRA